MRPEPQIAKTKNKKAIKWHLPLSEDLMQHCGLAIVTYDTHRPPSV